MNKKLRHLNLLVFMTLLFAVSCSDDEDTSEGQEPTPEKVVLMADFSTDQERYLAGDIVWITNTSTITGGTIGSWEWDFGITPENEELTIEKNPAIVYTEPDTYTIQLTVKALTGESATTTRQIVVARRNLAPEASFTWEPEEVCAEEEVRFTDTSTDDLGELSAWSWDFGDGGSSTEQNPTHTFLAEGSYTVKLTVTDSEGATGSTERVIEIQKKKIAEQLWAVQYAEDGNLLGASPAVGDRYVYVCSTAGSLVALDRTSGAEKWRFDLTRNSATVMSTVEGSSPSVDPADGTVVIAAGGSDGGNCCGFGINGETGEQIWLTEWPKSGSRIPWLAPVITENYITVANRATSGTAYIWNKSGRKVASSTISGIGGGMCARADERLFLFAGTGSNGFIAAIGSGDGSFTFAELGNSFGYGTVNANGCQPLIDAQGRFYAPSAGAVYCYDTNGYDGSTAPTLLWSNPTVSSNQICKGAGLSMSADGQTIYGTSQASELFALDASTGALRWRVAIHGQGYCVPAIDNLGQIHVCDNSGYYAIYSPVDGEELSSIQIGDMCYSSPAIADDGTVYITAEKEGSCYLFAFRIDGVTSAADSDWSQFGQNQHRTGVQRVK